jgi:hypothetical protein
MTIREAVLWKVALGRARSNQIPFLNFDAHSISLHSTRLDSQERSEESRGHRREKCLGEPRELQGGFRHIEPGLQQAVLSLSIVYMEHPQIFGMGTPFASKCHLTPAVPRESSIAKSSRISGSVHFQCCRRESFPSKVWTKTGSSVS